MTPTQWLEVAVSYALQVAAIVIFSHWLENRARNSATRCLVWNSCYVAVLVLGLTAVLLPRLHLIQPWSFLAPYQLLFATKVLSAISRWVLLLWAVGCVIQILRWMAGEIQLRRHLTECRILSESDVQSLFDRIGLVTTDDEIPRVFISDKNLGPCCWQIHRPTMLLPRFLIQGEPADLKHVIAHEREHLRTNHPLYLFLQQVVQTVFWFHPAVWAAEHRASLAREYVCDDAATAIHTNCAAYLRTLLRIAEHQCIRQPVYHANRFGRSQSEVVLRARRLTQPAEDRSRSHRGIGRKTVIAAVLVVACLLSQTWIPLDSQSSSRTWWSPWPSWTANIGHFFGWHLRDYERFDPRTQLYELNHLNLPNPN